MTFELLQAICKTFQPIVFILLLNKNKLLRARQGLVGHIKTWQQSFTFYQNIWSKIEKGGKERKKVAKNPNYEGKKRTFAQSSCRPTCSVLLYLVGCMGGWAWSDFLPCRGFGPPGWSSTRWANVPQLGLCICCSTRGPRARVWGKMFVSVRG